MQSVSEIVPRAKNRLPCSAKHPLHPFTNPLHAAKSRHDPLSGGLHRPEEIFCAFFYCKVSHYSVVEITISQIIQSVTEQQTTFIVFLFGPYNLNLHKTTKP